MEYAVLTGACPWCHDSPDAPIARRWVLRFDETVGRLTLAALVVNRVKGIRRKTRERGAVDLSWPNPQHLGGGSGRLANAGKGRFAYKELRIAWEWAVSLLAVDVMPATCQRRLTLVREWGKRQRALDPDNLVAGAKPLVDACTKAGLIIGDRRDQARIHYDQRKSADGVARVVITVEEFA